MFFVLCHARTGSHLLGSLLRSHPQIDFLSEPFKRSLQRLDFDRIMGPDARGSVMGADIKYGLVHQMDDGITDRIRGFPIIHLQRRDMVRTAICNLLEGTTCQPPIRIERSLFRLVYGMVKESSEIIRNDYPDAHTVYYEELCFNRSTDSFRDTWARRKLLDFIGVEDYELRTEMKKKHSSRIEDLVINHEEVLTWTETE